MTRFPREPLDAEERALAARLPRPHGRTEPGSALDARILAAAHAAAQSPLPASRRCARWTLPLGLAASLCLALGLAWRMQVTPPQGAATRAIETTTTAEQALPAAALGAPTPAADETTPSPAAALEQPAPVAVPAPKAVAPARTARIAPEESAASRALTPAAPPAPAAPALASKPAPPPLPAALPAPPDTAAAVATQAIHAEAGPPAAARAMARPTADARRIESAKAADARQADAPDEDIPPATVDAPEVREAWLRRIGELMRQGKTDEARASLMEFLRRYPEAELPVELRPLEPALPEPASR